MQLLNIGDTFCWDGFSWHMYLNKGFAGKTVMKKKKIVALQGNWMLDMVLEYSSKIKIVPNGQSKISDHPEALNIHKQ